MTERFQAIKDVLRRSNGNDLDNVGASLVSAEKCREAAVTLVSLL